MLTVTRPHKARNILERLPKSMHASVRRVLRQAWEMDDAERAETLICNLARRLEPDWNGVSASILEGIDEMLTVTRLGLPRELRRSPAPTSSRMSWARCAGSAATSNTGARPRWPSNGPPPPCRKQPRASVDPQQPGRRRQDRDGKAFRLAGLLGMETAPLGTAAGRRHLEGGDHLARPHRQGPRHRIPHGPGLRSPARAPAAGRPACGHVSPRPAPRRHGRCERGVPAAGRRHDPGRGVRDRHHHHQPHGLGRLPGPRYRGPVRDAVGHRTGLPRRKADPVQPGQPVTAATPAGAYRMAAATAAGHQALRIAGAAIAAAIGAEPARISATALRDAATAASAQDRAPGSRAERRDRHHPPRHHPAPAAVRHRLAARTATTPATPSRKSGPAKAGMLSPPRPGCTCSRCRSASRPRSRTHRQPPDRGPATRPGTATPGTPACPGSTHQPQERGSPRPSNTAGLPEHTGLTERNRNSSHTARKRPAIAYTK